MWVSGTHAADVLAHAFALCLAAATAKDDVRLDHRGSLGLLLGVGGLRKEASGSGIENTWRGSITVGMTIAVGHREQELVLAAVTSMTRTEVAILDPTGKVIVDRIYGFGIDAWLWGGYRVYFGEQWKTFVDLDLSVAVQPGFTAGPRVAIGLMHELSSLAGVYSTLSAQIGFGTNLVFRAELAIGVQLRSFLLED